MKKTFSFARKRKNLAVDVLIVVVSVLTIAMAGFAATTISTNISTDGTLSVTGNATTSANLVVGTTAWAVPTSTLSVVGNVNFHAKATTSDALWIGTAGNAGYVNEAGGDLYVQDSAEVDGNLFVAGRATSTSATTTNYLSVGSTFGVPVSLDFIGDLLVFDDAVINGKATSTEALWVGASTGVAGYLDMSNDLYVNDSLEVDGNLFVAGRATSTSATSTNYLQVGYPFAVPSSIDFSEDLIVSGDAVINGRASTTAATSTSYLWVGAKFRPLTGTLDYNGDLVVQDELVVGGNASTTGDVFVSGGTLDMATETATTTSGLFVRTSGTATSTVSIGDVTNTITKGCLELVGSDGAYYACGINEAGTALNCWAGRCKSGVTGD